MYLSASLFLIIPFLTSCSKYQVGTLLSTPSLFASCVILVHGESNSVEFQNIDQALTEPDTQIRLFGKPEVVGERRMGVCLSLGKNVEVARQKANAAASKIAAKL